MLDGRVASLLICAMGLKMRNTWVVVAFILYGATALAGPFDETRYCGEPKRAADGTLVRSQAVVSAFRKLHPCPRTGKTSGACVGWQVNHTIPLACGGCDAVSNMQWLPVQIKTGWQDWNIDRFERKINASSPPQPNTPACKNEPVIITDPINSN